MMLSPASRRRCPTRVLRPGEACFLSPAFLGSKKRPPILLATYHNFIIGIGSEITRRSTAAAALYRFDFPTVSLALLWFEVS